MLSGVVKSVLSGDSVVLLPPAAAALAAGSALPAERRLTLASVRVPRMRPVGLEETPPPPSTGEGGAAGVDEPWAFEARELLRRSLAGQLVHFSVDYVLDGEKQQREFGTIYVAPNDSMNARLVSAGLARVRRVSAAAADSGGSSARSNVSPEYDTLCELEEQAREAKRGLWSDELRPIGKSYVQCSDPIEFVARLRKNNVANAVPAVVEHVMNGSTLRVRVPCLNAARSGGAGAASSSTSPRRQQQQQEQGQQGAYHLFVFTLSGVQCPVFRRPADDDDKQSLSRAVFAPEAKFHTERALLHRDALISVDGADKNGSLFGSIVKPAEPDIGEQLLRLGLAKTLSWTLEQTRRAPALRAAEKSARDARLRVWRDYEPPTGAAAAADWRPFTGEVMEVVSGDTVLVRHPETESVVRLSLASVRAPRKGAPLAFETRELLRKRLIGTGECVHVRIEYGKTPQAAGASGASPEGSNAAPQQSPAEPMLFASLALKNGGGGEDDDKTQDIGLSLVQRGLATVVRHRNEEDRASEYDAYLHAERDAQTRKLGVFAAPDAQRSRPPFNDISGRDAARRAKEMLPIIERAAKHHGIVEYVSSGTRMKVLLPGEHLLISLALKGVRAPMPSRRLPEARPGEKHGDEALAFAKRTVLQRDCEATIRGIDRGGTFLGSLRIVGGKDFGAALVRAGYASVQDEYVDTGDGGALSLSFLHQCEQQARAKRLGIWQDYDEQLQLRQQQQRQEDEEHESTPATAETGASLRIGPNRAVRHVLESVQVCEVLPGGRLFLRVPDTPTQRRPSSVSSPVPAPAPAPDALASIESALARLDVDSNGAGAGAGAAASSPSAPARNPVEGKLYAARFALDDKYYRARILSAPSSGSVLVRFIDFGNEERVPLDALRPLPSDDAAHAPPQATEFRLWGVRVPDVDSEWCTDAGVQLRELVWGETLDAWVLATTTAAVGGGGGGGGATVAYGDLLVRDADARDHDNDDNGGGDAILRRDDAPPTTSVTRRLLRSGLARCVRAKSGRGAKDARDAAQAYGEDERVGMRTRAYLWEYGDAYASDEDDAEASDSTATTRRASRARK